MNLATDFPLICIGAAQRWLKYRPASLPIRSASAGCTKRPCEPPRPGICIGIFINNWLYKSHQSGACVRAAVCQFLGSNRDQAQFNGISFVRRHVFRFNAILLRDRFEQNKNIQDMRIARKLLTEGERELFEKQHPQPIACTHPAAYAGTVSVAFPAHLSAASIFGGYAKRSY